MQCVILVGGLGTRMRPATDALPKCLLPVLDRPFVDWQLEWLAGQGVDHVVLSIGFQGDLIRHHVGDGDRFGLEIDYVDEGDELLGTGGALRLAADRGVLDTTFFVIYGDSYLTLELATVRAAYVERAKPVLMTVYRDPGRLERPNVVFRDGLVTHYKKGLVDPPPDMRYVDYGLSAWRRQVVEKMVGRGEVADLATLFASLSVAGNLAGYEATERFYEIGSPRGLQDLKEYLGSIAAQGRQPF